MATDTFGYSGIGGSSYGQDANIIHGEHYEIGVSPAQNGYARKIACYCSLTNAGDKVRFGLYKMSDGSLVAYTEELTDITGDAWHEADIEVGDDVLLETTEKYYLVVFPDASLKIFYQDAPAEYDIWYDDGAFVYPNFPANVSLSQIALHREFSLYCTYEISAAPPTAPKGGSMAARMLAGKLI